MDGEYDLGSSSMKRDEFETKQKDPRQRGADDAERGLELADLRIHVEDDDELTQLRDKLADAKARHTKAEQDVQSPGWGRWVKYIFVTATEQANTVESSDFTVSRLALFGAVGIAGTAVSYLLPALDMSEIRSMDSATNTTSPTQTLTDHANVVYYWGNAASLGFTSIATFISGLAGIRRSYKAMRERILAQAVLERDQAQMNYDRYVKYTTRLKEIQEKYDAMEKSRETAVASALRTGKRLEAAQQRVTELEQALSSATTRQLKLEGALREADRATANEHEQVRALDSEIKRLKRELEEARADSKLSQQEADKQHEEADELNRLLQESRHTIEKQQLRIDALEHENKTSTHVISMLETAIVKIEQADSKIETVSAKITQLSEQAQSKVSDGSKETKD